MVCATFVLMPIKDMTGQKIGRWTVLGRGPDRVYPGGSSQPRWRCRCDCGTEKDVPGQSLRKGDSQSCGCLSAEIKTKHGATARNSPLRRSYDCWDRARGRCYDPKNPSYRWYGARGIRMCERWRSDFPAFLADMGACPPGYSLERLDVDRGYEPGNCTWIPCRDQTRNTRSNTWVEFRGQRMIQADFARLVGLAECTVGQRLKRGWTLEEIAETPPIARPHLLKFRGQMKGRKRERQRPHLDMAGKD